MNVSTKVKNINNIFSLSIVVPAYNAEATIEKTLFSIISATPNFLYEVIVVNDGSTDNTASIVNLYAQKYNNIKLVSQKNSGVSAARNNGIMHSSNKYVMFLDADDELVEEWTDAIEGCLNFELDLILFDYYKENNNRLIYVGGGNNSIDQIKKEYILTDNYNSVWAKLFRLSYIKNNNISFPIDIRIGEDAIFLGKVIENCKRIGYISKPVLIYKDNPSSVSNSCVFSYQDVDALFKVKYDVMTKTNLKFKDAFLEKIYGDVFSKLRSVSYNKDYFYEKIYELKSIDLYKRICRAEYMSLSVRRRIQLRILSKGFYGVLRWILKIEAWLMVKDCRIKSE